MAKELKTVMFFAILILVTLVLPTLWRKHQEQQIDENALYTFAKITKKTGSLKNGKSWHYTFHYKDQSYESNWPTHVDFEVAIDDYFIVKFSEENPENSRIMYEHKLKDGFEDSVYRVWKTIPYKFIKNERK